MLGIVQEQHPERARLFHQWKQLDWPLYVDSYNYLEVPYVPITLFIDEAGFVQYVVPFGETPGKALEDFLAQPVVTAPPVLGFQRKVDAGKPRFGDVASMDVAKLAKSEDQWDHFHAGVAYRARYDSPERESADFAKAVHHWTRALEIDPNNYIFRRRLQQYGPRLDKPYPFYDWVIEAREEITERGEEPLALVTEPG
ncbi:MAG: hypothetical protein HKN21_06845, partial [Candidatus Eisenbacteria bacterium]|nr:hypothetical protein [Candidatus Eisenbacteria bacterium]